MEVVKAVALLVGLVLPAGSELVGQAPTPFTVGRAPGPIRLDGSLDDAGWRGAPEIPLEWEWTPGDNAPPPARPVRLPDHL